MTATEPEGPGEWQCTAPGQDGSCIVDCADGVPVLNSSNQECTTSRPAGGKSQADGKKGGYSYGSDNLILNGGFENGLNDWDDYGFFFSSWRDQTGTTIFGTTVPPPPKGTHWAMTVQPFNFAWSAIYQDINVAQVLESDEFKFCSVVEFDVSFKVWWRNSGNPFSGTSILSSGVQLFTVDAVTTNFDHRQNIFRTTSDMDSELDSYKRIHGSFSLSNTFNTPLENDYVRLRFGVRASSGKLRVGVDQVRVVPRCALDSQTKVAQPSARNLGKSQI